MSRFLEDARQIFDVALEAEGSPCDLAILLHPETGIHMIADSGWLLASLQAHHGAGAAYQVRRNRGHITVEGRSGLQSCRLDSDTPALVARRMLGGSVLYSVREVAALPAAR